MTFIKHHKHHFGIFVILIIIAAVSGYFAFGTTNKTQNTRLPEPEAQSAAADGQAINKTQITKGEKLDSITTPAVSATGGTAGQASSTTSIINGTILRVNGEDYKTKFVSSTTVLDLMQEMQFEHKISFSGKEYSGMGFFVDEINGVKNDNLAGKYWIYYINSQSAQVGISNYIIKPNDVIEWKYENAKL